MIANAGNRMVAAQEEIFGPVVTVIPFEDEADAIRIANDVKYGLMATVWTGDPARGHRIASKIKSGTVGINMPYTAFPGIPFGGYKQSGFGRELALETLDLYLETKSVVTYTGSRPTNPFGLCSRRRVPLGRPRRGHVRAGDVLGDLVRRRRDGAVPARPRRPLARRRPAC